MLTCGCFLDGVVDLRPVGGRLVVKGAGMDATMLLLATHGHNAIMGHAPKRVTFANLTFSRPTPTTTFGRVVTVTPPAAAADAGAPAAPAAPAPASRLHTSGQQHGHIVIAVPEGQPGLDRLLIDRCASSELHHPPSTHPPCAQPHHPPSIDGSRSTH